MNRKQQIKKLWQRCFDDSEEFVEFFFDRVYKETNAVTLERGGTIVSALQMIPYTMTWCGTELQVAYISGACTAPEERGKGLMGELLRKSFGIMAEKEYDLTALIPAGASLFEFYRAYDYTEAFDYSLRTIEKSGQSSYPDRFEYLSPDRNPEPEWFAYFDRKLKERPICILHTQEDFLNNIFENHLDKGKVIGLSDNQGHPVGLAFATATKEKVFVKEILTDNDEIRDILIDKAMNLFQVDRAVYKTPSIASSGSHPYGMAKILRKEKMIDRWLDHHSDTPLSAKELNRMDNSTFIQTLLAYDKREAYMSLMLD